MYSIQIYSNENKHASNKNWFTNNAIIHNIDYKCKNLYLKKRKKKCSNLDQANEVLKNLPKGAMDWVRWATCISST